MPAKREPVIYQSVDGDWYIYEKDNSFWELYRDGVWRNDSRYGSDVWPTREAAEQFLASLATPEAVTAWQPIETAPKDGSEFLAVNVRQGDVVNLYRYHPIHHVWMEKGRSFLNMQATHWMPLPAPPSGVSLNK